MGDAPDTPDDDVSRVRKRAGMYVGATDGAGVLHLVLEVIGNAFDQHLAGRCSTIDVELAEDGTVFVRDDGPGMATEGGEGLPPIATMLAKLSRLPTVDGHRPHAHLGLTGVGLFVVSALSERFELDTVRDGVETRFVYARGRPIDPVVTARTTRPSGTTVRFRADPQIFAPTRVPRGALGQRLEELTFLAPELRLRWRFEEDPIARHGLAGWVSVMAPCSVERVAHRRATFGSADEPFEVEVALGWREGRWASDEARIDSFVNYARSIEGGSHVDGLLDGVCAFVRTADRAAASRRLVAAIAIVAADVTFGNPTRDRLAMPAARGPAAATTRLALAAWAKARPELAARVRADVAAR